MGVQDNYYSAQMTQGLAPSTARPLRFEASLRSPRMAAVSLGAGYRAMTGTPLDAARYPSQLDELECQAVTAGCRAVQPQLRQVQPSYSSALDIRARIVDQPYDVYCKVLASPLV